MLEVIEGNVELTADHRYHVWVDDIRLGPFPSVTKLIGPSGRFFPAGAAERGTRVHVACEVWDRVGMEASAPGEEGYLDAWRSFLADLGDRIRIEEIERAFVAGNGQVTYGGTIDRIVTIDGERAVLDLKSGARAPWHQLQLALYGAPFGIGLGYDVYVQKDGRYRVEEHRALPDAVDEYGRRAGWW